MDQLRIRKRDGTIQKWDASKVKRALILAFTDASDLPDGTQVSCIEELTRQIDSASFLSMDEIGAGIVDIETVQDIVEKELIANNYHSVAKHYILYREHHAKLRARARKPDNQAVADYIHAAKYARYVKDKKRKETYSETVDRVELMHLNKFVDSKSSPFEFYDQGDAKADLFRSEIYDAFAFVQEKQVLPSMRSMQFAGKAIEQQNARLYNCCYTLIDRTRAFQEIFHLLLCGCGVGYSVQWKHAKKLPIVSSDYNSKKVEHCTVEDSIEGWSDAIGELFAGFILGYYVEFNYSLIRAEGSILHISGGIAPGHIPLKECIEKIRVILTNAVGRQLRPIECSDIICHLAEAVLAGGIRRSSLMCLFSVEDTEMMYSKTPGNFRPSYNENDEGINDHRQMANISAVLKRDTVTKETFEEIIKMSQSFGEPGFFFTESDNYGTNPCGEIGLDPIDDEGNTGFAFCNLCEINVEACRDEDEFFEAARAAAFIGTLQASYTHFPYLGSVSERIAERSALLGIGLTGMADRPEIAFSPEALRYAAEIVVDENRRVAELIGINTAQRACTVKPSGTASLECGCVASGAHDHHSHKYFRRITANPNEVHAIEFARVNPHMVEIKPNGDLSLVFPIQTLDGASCIDDVTAKQFLERVFMIYENWILPGTASHMISPGLTHNVSATCTIREGEIDEVVDMLWENKEHVAAMSFAPYFLDTMYPFAPRQAVRTEQDEERFNRLIEAYKPVDWEAWIHEEDGQRPGMEPACSADGCEVT